MHTPSIGCLVMAAGNATRFSANKLAAEFDGKTLIRRALEAVPGDVLSAVTVVTQYPEVERLAEEFGFSHIKNEHPDYGISHTIRLGTQAMRDCDAIVYMVSDQPLLERASVERVVACWQENPSYIVGAAHNGKRGNPCIFPQEFFDELLALTEDHGGNTVIRAHPERLMTVEVGKTELTDVDTPQALENLKKQQ
ncbi:MAG: nucleotidyltransferase family protein [Oscillospiraceae bacterium]|nr:nucleotidyltransferase family protein [Oscillospiraceae bacterium]